MVEQVDAEGIGTLLESESSRRCVRSWGADPSDVERDGAGHSFDMRKTRGGIWSAPKRGAHWVSRNRGS